MNTLSPGKSDEKALLEAIGRPTKKLKDLLYLLRMKYGHETYDHLKIFDKRGISRGTKSKIAIRPLICDFIYVYEQATNKKAGEQFHQAKDKTLGILAGAAKRDELQLLRKRKKC